MLRSELHGEMKMKSFLVGTPVVRISLNEDIDMAQQHSKAIGQYVCLACYHGNN